MQTNVLVPKRPVLWMLWIVDAVKLDDISFSSIFSWYKLACS
jgi:hypothetical protein